MKILIPLLRLQQLGGYYNIQTYRHATFILIKMFMYLHNYTCVYQEG